MNAAFLPAPHCSMRTHMLHPGDVSCAHGDDRLETLLRSCVAVVITDPAARPGHRAHAA